MSRLNQVVLLISWAFLWTHPAAAHPELGQYIQHRLQLTVSPGNIDLTIELALNGSPALAERKSMDRNGDSAISSTERALYAAALEARATAALRLFVDNTQIDLIPLFGPGVDLLDTRAVEPHPHTITFQYFVRTPRTFKAGSTIRVESALWLDQPALLICEVGGIDGVTLETTPSTKTFFPGGIAGKPRAFDVRCTKVTPMGFGGSASSGARAETRRQVGPAKQERSERP